MKSETRYEKRQEGRAIQFSSAIISLAGLWLITNEARPTAGLTLLGIAGVLSMLFGSMTVSIDHEALRFHFGWGLIRKQIAFCDLRSWHVVKVPLDLRVWDQTLWQGLDVPSVRKSSGGVAFGGQSTITA